MHKQIWGSEAHHWGDSAPFAFGEGVSHWIRKNYQALKTTCTVEEKKNVKLSDECN